MKGYWLILFLAGGFGFLTNNFTVSEIPKAQDVHISSETPTKDLLMSTIDDISKIPSIDLLSTANIDTPTTVKNTSDEVSKAPAAVNHRVTVYSNELVVYPDYQNVYQTDRLIYAHNTANLLGSIKNYNPGDIISISNGSTSSYIVSKVAIFEKVNSYTLQLCINNDYGGCSGSTYYMNTLKNAVFMGQKHDLVLMTCDGTPLGNGDATHRRFVFVDKI